jgi:hypothetical protein
MSEVKSTIKQNTENVVFSPEQMEVVQALIAQSRDVSTKKEREAISRFTNTRNKKEIMSVPIYQFDGKFVIGFKDLNKNPYRKTAKYCELKLDIHRKLADQPFVTLLLSSDGEDIEEKEVSLIDYMGNREKVIIEKPNFEITTEEVIEDHGIVGKGGGGTFAAEIDGSGRTVTPMLVKAETKLERRTYKINLPGFKKPVKLIEEFLA